LSVRRRGLSHLRLLQVARLRELRAAAAPVAQMPPPREPAVLPWKVLLLTRCSVPELSTPPPSDEALLPVNPPPRQ